MFTCSNICTIFFSFYGASVINDHHWTRQNAIPKEGFLWTPNHTHSGLQTDSIQPSTSTIEPYHDIIVIGSGFAGLIAARDLTQKYNLNVLLIEARDRIGGRTWTAKVLDEELEMGGTWVHWAQPHVYNELQRYGLHQCISKNCNGLMDGCCLRVRIGRMVGGGL